MSRKQRISIRDIAAEAGVSTTTVSLALRNHPRISPATIQRIKSIAEHLDYKPDPVLTRLMTHLHAPGSATGGEVIAVVTPYRDPNTASEAFLRRLFAGGAIKTGAEAAVKTIITITVL